MPRLVIIDHSLKRTDGHHYDYALHVMRAAAELGLKPILATNRKLRHCPALPPGSAHYPVFRSSTYSRFALGSSRPQNGGTILPEPGLARSALLSALANHLGRWFFHLGRQQHIQSFADACHRLFADIGWQNRDQVFLPTMSELDLLGLSRFLSQVPKGISADWHVQFHYAPVTDGTQGADEAIRHMEAMKQSLHMSAAGLSGWRLHYYATTEGLCRHYNQLCCGQFQLLAYPINPALLGPLPDRRNPRPMRVACLGGPREEKGLAALVEASSELASEIQGGQLQFLVQSHRTKQSARWRSRGRRRESVEQADAACMRLPHPLAIDAYVHLIRSADIGWMLYDRRRYAIRRAGVLGEFLAAGVPVVVSAGCWLADQVAEPVYRHVERLCETATLVTRSPGTACRQSNQWTIRERPRESRECVVSLMRPRRCDTSRLVQLTICQISASGQEVDVCVTLHGQRPESDWVHVLIPLHASTQEIHCRWSVSESHDPSGVESIQAKFLEPLPDFHAGRPMGAVGLMAATPFEAVRQLRDILRHYDHYRTTAAEFALEWSARHDPRQTVRQLLNGSG